MGLGVQVGSPSSILSRASKPQRDLSRRSIPWLRRSGLTRGAHPAHSRPDTRVTGK
jgi:hypothetical protein